MKNLLHKAIILAMLATLWTGCSEEDTMLPVDIETAAESGSTISISMNLNIPDPIRVSSRGVVTEAIENITVLCFDRNGEALAPITELSFESDENADEKQKPAGSMKAKIPSVTRIMHVLANQSVQVVKGNTEAEVLNTLESTSNKMVYWGRLEVPADITSSAEVKAWWAENKTITLLRNMAKVEVSVNTDDFELLGFTVVNTNALGYAAPYYAEGNVYPTDGTDFDLAKWIETDYIHAAGTDLVSGTKEPMTANAVYVYETPSTTKASIIIKGRNKTDAENVEKYWRVAFADLDAKQINIRRNHRYTVNIDGALLYGDEDERNESGGLVKSGFEKAVSNSAIANRPTISDEITAIGYRDFSLTLEQTSYVLMDGTQTLSFGFDIVQKGSEDFKDTDLSVTWENGQNVSESNDVPFTIAKSKDNEKLFEGSVSISLQRLGTEIEREGTIVIKYGKKLQRKVKIIIIGKFDFGANEIIYYEEEDENPNNAIAKLKITIPESYPKEMYPFNILISTEDFNVKRTDGKGLSIILEGEGGYGEKTFEFEGQEPINSFGFKYIYQVNWREPEKNADGSEIRDCEYYIDLIGNSIVTETGKVIIESGHFNPIQISVPLMKSEE